MLRNSACQNWNNFGGPVTRNSLGELWTLGNFSTCTNESAYHDTCVEQTRARIVFGVCSGSAVNIPKDCLTAGR